MTPPALGVVLPTTGVAAPRANVVQLAAAADDLGFAHVWAFHRILYALDATRAHRFLRPRAGAWPKFFERVLDPLQVLSLVAATTERVRLGTCVINLPYYTPIVLAKELATLDLLSDGRVELGAGIGWSLDELAAVGVRPERRGARADEFIRCRGTERSRCGSCGTGDIRDGHGVPAGSGWRWLMASFDFRDVACIVGVGTSEQFALRQEKSPITLQVEAFRAALDDAGLQREDVDGFSTAQGAPHGVDYDEFAVLTGSQFRWINQNWSHGRWAATSIAHAALAVGAGLCDVVAVANTTMSAKGYGRYLPAHHDQEGLRDAGGGHGERAEAGLDTPGAGTALVASTYMKRYGATSEELATTALTFRRHANLNPMAIMRDKRMTIDDYLASPYVTAPFRLFDYCLTNEGSTCLLVTSPERARDLRHQPVFIRGHQGVRSSREDFVLFGRPGLGVGYGEAYEYHAPEQPVYAMAGVQQSDIDVLYVYDSFSTNLWMILERFGFCGEGEGHEWVQGGRIELGGELPVNTNGGLMSEGHFSGYAHLIEMVRQLRDECGPRQVDGAEVAQWATPWGDSLILTAA